MKLQEETSACKSCLIIKGNSTEERNNTWLNHFRNLLGQPPDENNTVIRNQHEGLRIDTGPFNLDEYKADKTKISEGKVGGEDGIVPEILKRCNIDDICNRALKNVHIPESWKTSTIIPIPKKENRGIAITSQVAKTLAAVLVVIDFKKAFDSVHRRNLMKILRAYGIPKEIVGLIEKFYTNTKDQVLTP